MATKSPPPTRKQAFVAALQWGLVQTFVVDSVGRLAQNYYHATTDSVLSPGWVTTVQFAAPLGLLVGGYGGYRWLTSGRGVATLSAHRARVRFVGGLVTAWALAIVPVIAFEWLLDDQLFTVPYFLLPSLVSTLVLGVAYVLGYRVGNEWYDRHRSQILGAGQGALVGLLLGVVGFTLYSGYVAATQSAYRVDGGPGIVVAVALGGVGGSLLDGQDAGDRAAEFVTLLLVSVFVIPLVTAVCIATLGTLGVDSVSFGSLYPLVSIGFALVLATVLTYRVRTNVYGRLVGKGES